MMDGRTALAGIVGWPVSHSRSPLLHNYWCKRYGVNGAYVPLPVMPDAVETALRGLLAVGFRGVNVTIPHKEAAFRACDDLTLMACRAGAANTLLFDEGRIVGDCTDGTGFCSNLYAQGEHDDDPVLILGAGGAARAIAAAFLAKGRTVMIANRTPERAQAVVKALGGGTVVPWERWPQALHDVTLLVNATALGMEGKADLPWMEAFSSGPETLCVADTVYTPLDTCLLRTARARGWRTVDGLGMLLHQAGKGFQQWFGITPEVDDDVFTLLKRDLGVL